MAASNTTVPAPILVTLWVPLLAMLPENPPRGGGIEIRLYDTDPDGAVARAKALGATVLQEPTDKPHGLREAYILCDNGYAWVPSRAKD